MGDRLTFLGHSTVLVRGAPTIYVDYTGCDAIAHHCGRLLNIIGWTTTIAMGMAAVGLIVTTILG